MSDGTASAGVDFFAAARDRRAAREVRSRELWAMTPDERVAAMWKGELCLSQLREWSATAPREVPIISGEYAWIAMRTPEWAESADP